MEQLIHQAFAHVDLIGKEVHAGHYDLVGPAGEIILPQVWETMAKPDMDIEMRMWPMPEKKVAHPPHHGPPGHGHPMHGHPGHPPPHDNRAAHMDAIAQILGKSGGKPSKSTKPSSKSRGSAMGPPPAPPIPRGAPMGPGGVPPPPPPPPTGAFLAGLMRGDGPPPPPTSEAGSLTKSKKGSSKSKKGGSSFLKWAAGTAGASRSSSVSGRRRG
jgi:hypothetical protein